MKTEKISLFQQFIFWREKNIKEKHFILILSFIVGVCTASAAIILKSLDSFDSKLSDRQF